MEKREAITLVNAGKKIFGLLHLPLLDTPAPLVVICSGYAGQKTGKFRLFVRLSQALAKCGIASFRFDYRGTGDSEGELEDLTIESQVSDTLYCLNFLKNYAGIDSEKIALFGRSLGGIIAVLSCEQFKEIKSLCLWAPVFTSDPWKNLWKLSSGKFQFQEQKIVHNFPPLIPHPLFLEQFFQIDMKEELVKIKHIPLLHIHADQDVVVTEEHKLGYQQARKDSLHSSFISLPHSDHEFSLLEEQEIAIKETCDWYKKTLHNSI